MKSIRFDLKYAVHIFRENLLDTPEASLSLTHQINHEFNAELIIEASILQR